MGKTVKRLYNEFQPKHYKIDLSPDKESMTFSGQVIVSGKRTGKPSQRFTFHQVGLKITKAHLVKHDKTGDVDIVVDRINNQNSQDEVRLHTKTMLYPGSYTVRLEFEGTITRNMNGIYPCFFQHENNEKKIIATQFESHHAREVFPCIDEPEAKATFELSLEHPTNEAVISNTPIKSQSEKNGRSITLFEPTPHMSTYLLAFVIGDLSHLEATTKHGVQVRTYATPDNVEHTQFALDVAVKTLDFYNEYFAIEYPLEKCDMIALPDFASGAMENWGCITYREHALFVDEANTTLGTKQYVAMVVAHELAHQWFGNLVTMRWWTDLWLNEGFASWIEYLAVDDMFPEWEMWTQFAVDEQQQALKLDALENTHPIEVPVNHPDEIRSIFDAISYSKGASVIHMLHQYLGPEYFRDGLRFYLQKHKYDNTDTIDLWAALEEISGKPVREFMHAWTTLSGFPIIQADITENQSITLTQEKFFINPNHTKDKEPHLWPIATLSTSDDLPNLMKEQTLSVESSDTSTFVLNKGQSGFYRVAYNSTHLQRLGELIQRGKIEPIDRLGILSDAFETAKAGKTDTADVLHFMEFFKQEDDYAVWEVIAGILGSIRGVMNDEDLRESMKPYTRELVSTQLERLGWDRKDNDSHFDRLLRPIILGMAAAADEPWVVDKCLQTFKAAHDVEEVDPDLRVTAPSKQVKRGTDIDPDLRGTVFGTVARHGGKKEFEKLLALHNNSKLSEERTTIAAALTGFQQPELVQRALSLITTDTVRLQDVAYWIAYSFLNRHGKDVTWEWMTKHWSWLEKNLGTDLSFYRMPIYAGRAFSDDAFIPEFKKFFEPKITPALDRSYKQGLEMLEWQSAWRNRSLKEVKNFFSS